MAAPVTSPPGGCWQASACAPTLEVRLDNGPIESARYTDALLHEFDLRLQRGEYGQLTLRPVWKVDATSHLDPADLTRIVFHLSFGIDLGRSGTSESSACIAMDQVNPASLALLRGLGVAHLSVSVDSPVDPRRLRELASRVFDCGFASRALLCRRPVAAFEDALPRPPAWWNLIVLPAHDSSDMARALLRQRHVAIGLGRYVAPTAPDLLPPDDPHRWPRLPTFGIGAGARTIDLQAHASNIGDPGAYCARLEADQLPVGSVTALRPASTLSAQALRDLIRTRCVPAELGRADPAYDAALRHEQRLGRLARVGDAYQLTSAGQHQLAALCHALGPHGSAFRDDAREPVPPSNASPGRRSARRHAPEWDACSGVPSF